MAEELQITVMEPEAILPPKPQPKARRTKRPAEVSGDAPANEVESEPELSDPVALPILIETPVRTKDTTTPKAGPPSLEEWQDFLGRIVLKTATQGWISLMLKDLDLTERELSSITLTKDDLNEMSAPIASLVNKSKRGKKHGRAIIAAADSYEAVFALVIWMRRVRRIARKHKPVTAESTIQGSVIADEHSGSNGSQGPQHGYRIYNPGSG